MVCSVPSWRLYSSGGGKLFIILYDKKSRGWTAPGLVDSGAPWCHHRSKFCIYFALFRVWASVLHTISSWPQKELRLFLKREKITRILPGDFSLAKTVLVHWSHWTWGDVVGWRTTWLGSQGPVVGVPVLQSLCWVTLDKSLPLAGS